MKFRYVLPALMVLAATHAPVYAQAGNTQNGATLGGLAGAVIGGVVGHQNDEAIEGVLIGGAVGAVTGGLFGHAQDHRQGYYAPSQPVYQQRQVRTAVPYYPTQTTTTTTVAGRKPVTIADVITLSRSGVNDGVIINQIQANGIQSRPEVNEVLLMHQQGVSDVVIAAMQNLGTVNPTTITTYSSASPVIVQETPVIVQQPVYAAPPPVIYRHAHGHGHYWHRF